MSGRARKSPRTRSRIRASAMTSSRSVSIPTAANRPDSDPRSVSTPRATPPETFSTRVAAISQRCTWSRPVAGWAATTTTTSSLPKVGYYRTVATRAVIAVRARIGSIDPLNHEITSADQPALEIGVPFHKRYFLGGATNLRGWGRFDVAPLSENGLPNGGHSFIDFSTEVRVPIWGKLGGVIFLDGGNVWTNPWDLQFERSLLRRRSGPSLHHADRTDTCGLWLPAESDPRSDRQRRARAASLSFPLQHRSGVLTVR